LVELETDKVDVEVAAPKAGVLQSIAHGDGADVKIGDVLGVIEIGATSADGTKSEVRSQPPSREATAARIALATAGSQK
jgi:2-oxoglutarate dehydrogenase E2 component (dihydrolipoamide succinyltransferase)